MQAHRVCNSATPSRTPLRFSLFTLRWAPTRRFGKTSVLSLDIITYRGLLIKTLMRISKHTFRELGWSGLWAQNGRWLGDGCRRGELVGGTWSIRDAESQAWWVSRRVSASRGEKLGVRGSGYFPRFLLRTFLSPIILL